MKTAEQRAVDVVSALDLERKTGYCDEYGIIADAFRGDAERMARYENALKKIAASDEYKGADSVATKLGRAMDIARIALNGGD